MTVTAPAEMERRHIRLRDPLIHEDILSEHAEFLSTLADVGLPSSGTDNNECN